MFGNTWRAYEHNVELRVVVFDLFAFLRIGIPKMNAKA
jgi:hypothetical protein